jgi:carbon storage regulator
MLVLTRKIGEEIVIGDDIRVIVAAIQGNNVRLGFTAPAEVLIRRSELLRKVDVGPVEKVSSDGPPAESAGLASAPELSG